MKKYQKQFPVGIRIGFYTVLLIVVILFATICLIDTLSHPNDLRSVLSIVSMVSMTVITFASLAYPIAQDIRHIRRGRKMQPSFVWKDEIPFVDREELIEEVLTEISDTIVNNDSYLQKYIRYASHNGKKSFAKKLCIQLDRIKHKREIVSYFAPEAAAKIGNIQMVKYTPPVDEFELDLKTNFLCVKGKKNIVVVQNSSGEPLTGLDQLADHSVLLVILNFTQEAKDTLQFPDDKIVVLIDKIRTIPKYEPLFRGKSVAELQEIAIKMGKLSHNNIGEIIKLLSDDEFAMLLETDREFLDFYGLLKQAKYREAEKKYHELSPVPQDKLLLRYKREYEHANLLHFLGKYGEALAELGKLILDMTTVNSNSISEPWGKMLYCDAILLQSHTLKHQGKFDEAATALEQVSLEQHDLNWIKYHFSTNIFQLNEMRSGSPKWDTLLLELKTMMETFALERKLINSDYYFYEAFYPIVKFYYSNFDHQIIPCLIQMTEEAIQYYEKYERRFVTNCYFIKAEFLRILGNWEEAKKFYEYCHDIYRYNGDKDILYLVAITCKCVEQFDGVPMEIGCNFDKVIEACKQEDDYSFHRRLISQMELAEYDQKYQEQWLSRYHATINPIP